MQSKQIINIKNLANKPFVFGPKHNHPFTPETEHLIQHFFLQALYKTLLNRIYIQYKTNYTNKKFLKSYELLTTQNQKQTTICIFAKNNFNEQPF